MALENIFALFWMVCVLLISSQTAPEDTAEIPPLTPENIDELRVEMRRVMDESGNNHQLLPRLVRLIFHDCAGPLDIDGTAISRCNGCIDLDNLEAHAGLQSAITPLEAIYVIWSGEISRADFWALAATVALEYAKELDTSYPDDILPSIPYYFGRIDCPTSPDAVDTKTFVGGGWGWTNVSNWFNQQLGFTERETVTIIGAHTLGKCHQQWSGYSSIRWKRFGPDMLNNEFYDNLFNFEWAQEISPRGLWEWRVDDRGREILMLNSDMSLIIDIDDHFAWWDDNGLLTSDCQIENCPLSEVRSIAQEFADDNQLWLNEFVQVFIKLITTGYDVNDLTVVDANPLNAYSVGIHTDIKEDDKGEHGNVSNTILSWIIGFGVVWLAIGICIGQCMLKQPPKPVEIYK